MLNRFFKKRSTSLTKDEYWKKWEFFELTQDLHKAVEILSPLKGGYSSGFISAEEFHVALTDAIDDIEFGNRTDLTEFYNWFAPTSAWDDFVGIDGIEIGNRIFERVSRWKKAHN
jgi:hypothetical protein